MAAVERTSQAPNKHVTPPWMDSKAEPYIRVENVTKKFGEFVAVNNVSLNVYRGELFSLLGGSGCGKTTLLRMLAGFENRPAARSISTASTWRVSRPMTARPT
jgi:putrescine transport system ATP-binding protein